MYRTKIFGKDYQIIWQNDIGYSYRIIWHCELKLLVTVANVFGDSHEIVW